MLLKNILIKILFLHRVESNVAQGEITNDQQLLLYPQCFQWLYAEDASASGKRLTLSLI